MGASIAKFISENNKVYVMFLADGESSRFTGTSEVQASQLVNERKKCSVMAAEILGCEIIKHCAFPDNRMDSVCFLDIVKEIEQVISNIKPDTIFTHFGFDLNVDHRITSEAVMTAARPQPGSPVKRIFNFEVASATGWLETNRAFTPNYHIALNEEHWTKKLLALDVYADEMREFPHVRSVDAIEAQATYRGTQMGVTRSESFLLVRWIED